MNTSIKSNGAATFESAAQAQESIVLQRGSKRVRIRHEPGDNRLPWRLIWRLEGRRYSQMFDSPEAAKKAGEEKLSELTAGEQVLSHQEVDRLFAFKKEIEALERRVQTVGLTLEEAVSELAAAERILPGMKVSAMAQTILQNYGVANPQTVDQASTDYLKHLRSGYKRNYSDDYLDSAQLYLERFSQKFGPRRIDTITEGEVKRFIDGYKVRTRTGGVRRRMRAPAKTRSLIKGHLQGFFKYAKNLLQALPENLETVVERLPAYRFVVRKLPIFVPAELNKGMHLLPDVECLLYAGFRAFSGLRDCEIMKLEGRDIKEKTIVVRPEVGKRNANARHILPDPREVPILAPLASLLTGIKLPPGRIFFTVYLNRKVARIFRKAGLPATRNIFRHSFVSYRLAVLKNREKAAAEAGHEILRQIIHYERNANPADVPKYWALRFSARGLPYTTNHYASKSLKNRVKKSQCAEGQLHESW